MTEPPPDAPLPAPRAVRVGGGEWAPWSAIQGVKTHDCTMTAPYVVDSGCCLSCA